MLTETQLESLATFLYDIGADPKGLHRSIVGITEEFEGYGASTERLFYKYPRDMEDFSKFRDELSNVLPDVDTGHWFTIDALEAVAEWDAVN